jgi:hypothetical protein
VAGITRAIRLWQKLDSLSVKNTRQMATKQELPQERKQLRYQLLKLWLGREDSNLCISESEFAIRTSL